jgi:hypothetical protein
MIRRLLAGKEQAGEKQLLIEIPQTQKHSFPAEGAAAAPS